MLWSEFLTAEYICELVTFNELGGCKLLASEHDCELAAFIELEVVVTAEYKWELLIRPC